MPQANPRSTTTARNRHFMRCNLRISIVYVVPVNCSFQVRAAKGGGLVESHDTLLLRVEGDNEAGLAFRLTQQWALAGISLQGLAMSVLGNKFVGYAKFDTITDVNKAAQILADLGSSLNNPV